jgi:hypothetical protein
MRRPSIHDAGASRARGRSCKALRRCLLSVESHFLALELFLPRFFRGDDVVSCGAGICRTRPC